MTLCSNQFEQHLPKEKASDETEDDVIHEEIVGQCKQDSVEVR